MMKTNQKTIIYGKKVVLVPYRKEHVPRYHEWMKNKELQELTASEPLSLQQEYEMQKSWREDDDKCTFIVLDAEKYHKSKSEVESMVGDVNLFFNDEDDKHTAELEIMIAETYCRGKGLGTEATMGMMKYGSERLGVNTFVVKIGYSNMKSQNLFKKFNFVEISRSDVFEEVTMSHVLNDANLTWLQQCTADLRIEDCESIS